MYHTSDLGPGRQEVRQSLRLEWLSGDPSLHGCCTLKPPEKITLLEVSPGCSWVSYLWGMVIRAHIHQAVPGSLPGSAVPLSKEDFTAISRLEMKLFKQVI